jgi:hypothetical protein
MVAPAWRSSGLIREPYHQFARGLANNDAVHPMPLDAFCSAFDFPPPRANFNLQRRPGFQQRRVGECPHLHPDGIDVDLMFEAYAARYRTGGHCNDCM